MRQSQTVTPPRLDPTVYKTVLLILLLAQGLTVTSLAATVQSQKGSKALLHLESGEAAHVGDTYVQLDDDKKLKLELLVTAVKGDQAMSDIQTGQPSVGDHLLLVAAPQVQAAPAAVVRTRLHNLVFQESIDSESVVLSSTTQVAMTGLSPALRLTLSDWFSTEPTSRLRKFEWELGAGFEDLRTTGTLGIAACGGSSNCVFDIPSITAIGNLAWLPFGHHRLDFALRAGADILIPVSVTSNVISYSAYTPLLFLTGGALFRFKLNENHSLPIGVDGAVYSGNSSVTIVRVMFSAGYSWK